MSFSDPTGYGLSAQPQSASEPAFAVAHGAPPAAPAVALDFALLAERARQEAGEEQLLRWAKQFASTVPVLRHIGIGFDAERSAMTIPERDAMGFVVGISLRGADGRKWCVAGSKRGLTFSHPLALDKDDIVLIVEGASDVMAGEALGLPRVSVVGRPSATGGFDELAKLPAHCRYIVCGENDGGIGPKAADDLARKLAELGRKSGVIFPPAHIKDLRQWVQSVPSAGLSIMVAIENVKWIDPRPREQAVPSAHLVFDTDNLKDVDRRAIDWLWPNRFARGKLSLVSGHPGVGKSTLMIDIASRISAGKPMPDGAVYEGPRKVLLISGEDDPADTIRPRVEAAGGDVGQIVVHKAVRDLRRGGRTQCLSLRDHSEVLSRFIRDTGPYAMVVVDPISAYMGQTECNSNTDVRSVLLPLAELAQEHDCAFIGVTHLNKSGDNSKAILRSMGSLAFVAAARTVFLVIEDPTDKTRRLFLFGKSNIGMDPGGLAYRIEDEIDPGEAKGRVGRLVWDEQRIDTNADEVFRSLAAATTETGTSKIQSACDFLMEFLAQGPRQAADVFSTAENAGLPNWVVQGARKAMNIVARKVGATWQWSLPRRSEPQPLHAHPDEGR